MGSGESMNFDPFGIDWDRPVSRTVEALEIMKRLWKEDEPFSFQGEFYNLENGFLQLDSIQKPHPPIYIAANGPRAMRLVGRYYDGWVPMLETPEIYGKHVKIIEEGAKENGRSIDDVDCSLTGVSIVCEDTNDAYDIVAPIRQFLIYLPKKLVEAGYKAPAGYPDNYYLENLMVTKEDTEKCAKAREYITEEMVRDFLVIGTVEECIDKIERYQKAGLNKLIIINLDPERERTLGYYEKEIIPYFEEQ